MNPRASWDFASGCVLLSFSAILIALVIWSGSCAEEKWDAQIFLEVRKFAQQDTEMFLFGGKTKTDGNFPITVLLQMLQFTAVK